MRRLVHVLTSTATAAWISGLALRRGGTEVLGVAYVTSLCINWLLDYLGHSGGRRSPLTHEPLNASAISFAVALALSSLYLYDLELTLATLVASGVSFLTHLALDLLSGGIYVRDGGSYRRVRLLKLRGHLYSVANSTALALSIASIAAYLLNPYLR
ncbi:MAG: hypothetical protein LM571_02745 [Desulfurococcaceae archaeon]|nr:hypothetical protein [Desulfurococcaceae archaeon]